MKLNLKPLQMILLFSGLLLGGVIAAQGQDSLSLSLAAPSEPLAPGEAGTIEFALVNRGGVDATNVGFSVELPTGVVLAPSPSATSDCPAGSFDAAGGSNTFSYSGGTVLLSSRCLITVNVVAPEPGDYKMITSPLTSSLGTGAPASDTLHIKTAKSLLGLALEATVSGTEVTFDLYVENLDSASLEELHLFHDLDSAFGSRNYWFTAAPAFVDDPGTFALNPSFDGSADTELILHPALNGRDTDAPSLVASDTAHLHFTIDVIDATDMGAGVGIFESQVSGSAWTATGITTDLSDDGSNPDPDMSGDASNAGEDDPTSVYLMTTPSIGVACYVKILEESAATVYSSGSTTVMLGPKVRLYWVVENLGEADITNVTLTDNLDAVFGAGNYGVVKDSSPIEIIQNGARLTANQNFDGSTDPSVLGAGGVLAPAERAVIQVDVIVQTISDQGYGYGVYANQASAAGESAEAMPAQDFSDAGRVTDANANGYAGDTGEDDPTRFSLVSYIGLAKDVTIGSGSSIFIDYYLEVFGNSTMTDLYLSDNYDSIFGKGNYFISDATLIDDPGTLSLNPGFDGSADKLLFADGSTLLAGDTAQIRVAVELTEIMNAGDGIGRFSDSTYVSATQENGAEVADVSTSGTDSDPNADDNPTSFGENMETTFSVVPDALVGGALSDTTIGNQVILNLYLENFGNSATMGLSLIYSLDDTFGAGQYTIVAAPAFLDDPGTLVLNPAFDGSLETELLASGSSLVVGDTAQITLTVELTNTDYKGVFTSQFKLLTTDASGRTASDLSTSGTDPDPNGDGDPTYPDENEPTDLIFGTSSLGLAIGVDVEGTLLTYTYTVENLGDFPISNVSLANQIFTVFGFGNTSITQPPTLIEGPATLSLYSSYDGTFSSTLLIAAGSSIDAGETIRFTLQVSVNNVTDQGLGYGIYENQTTISGSANSVLLSDVSDEGYFSDPNGDGDPGGADENDATRIIIGDEGRIGLSESATLDENEVTLDIHLENLGASMLSSVLVEKNLDDIFGAGNYTLSSGPVFIDDPGTLTLNPVYDGSNDDMLLSTNSTLANGDTATIRFVVNVSTLDNVGHGYGFYQSQSEVTATAPQGSLVYDQSDAGTDPDPNGNGRAFEPGENDPLLLNLSTPQLGAALEVSVEGLQVTLKYTVANIGDNVFTNLSLPHDLDGLFGAGNYSIFTRPNFSGAYRGLDLNPNFNGRTDVELIKGGSIGPGVTETFYVTVKVNLVVNSGSGLGAYTTQVELTGQSVLGAAADVSTSGAIPDLNGNGFANESGESDATYFFVEESPMIGVALSTSVTGYVATVDIVFENFGDVPLSNLSAPFDLDAVFGAGNYVIKQSPFWIQDPGTISIEGAYNGSSTPDLFSSGTLALGAKGHVRFVTEVTGVTDQGEGMGIYSGQISISGQSPAGTDVSDLSDDGIEPDPNGNDNPTESGENDATTIELEGSIGDFVWNDLNGDGNQDGSEPGLSGVTVFLDLNTNMTLDAGEPLDTTDASGSFSISNVASATYSVRVNPATIPSGFALTGGSHPRSVSLQPSEDLNTTDFGYQQQDATIGDFVWNDLNGDGIHDGGETGIVGVTVYLDLNTNGMFDGGEPSDTSDSTGAYDITDLPAGSYSVRLDSVPPGFVLTGGGHPQSVSLSAGEDQNGGDFGCQQQDATIGDFVWNDLNGDGIQDGGEPGLSGVTLFLDSNTNGMWDAGEPSNTTDMAGSYDITALPTGTYNVLVDATTVPSGFVLTGGTHTQSVSIAAGEDLNSTDFGYQQQDATIGDFVWNDLNGDGIQDGGETGIVDVTVYLDLNTNGTWDAGEPSNTTDTAGAYDITDLPTDIYSVRVDATTVPSGFVMTGGTHPQSVSLAAGENHNSTDFGYQQQDATIGDFVWNDLNGDGIQDGGETGIVDVTVYLDLNTNGTLDAGEPSDTTDAAGAYDVTNLPTGTNSVRVDLTTVPSGFVLTSGTHPLSVFLVAGEDNNSTDFGYQQQDATIGDFIWNDLNGDGIQDGGETGIVDVTVYLDLNTNGVLDGGEPSDTTDATGAYDITDLTAGTYSVRVDATTVPSGFVLTSGPHPQVVLLTAGEDDNAADFGYQQQDASIGDFVWDDLNSDGIQNGGETGLVGVTVYLDLNSNGSLDAGEPNDATDVSGIYNIANLPTGTYRVRVDRTTLPIRFIPTGGVTTPQFVSLATGEAYDAADFGYQQLDTTNNDYDGDGIADLSVYWPEGGNWYIRYSGGGNRRQNWGWSEVVPVPGDYDGDGITDIAVYWQHDSTNNWFILQSSDGTMMSGHPIDWGWSEVMPVPGDYDGDGVTDIAVYRPYDGSNNWYVLQSSDGTMMSGGPINWGWSEVTPVPGDYDGDGITDIAVYWQHDSTNNWFVRKSSDGTMMSGAPIDWGWSEAVPVPGDYDGDGITDLAVYWPAAGNWYIRYSAGGTRIQNWGWGATIPVPDDYDGDGITDIAVYWPYDGTRNWFILKSSDGTILSGRPIDWGWSEAYPTHTSFWTN